MCVSRPAGSPEGSAGNVLNVVRALAEMNFSAHSVGALHRHGHPRFLVTRERSDLDGRPGERWMRCRRRRPQTDTGHGYWV
jgi:hypothetical protein